MLIHCKDSFCRRMRKWFPSVKILIVQKYCFFFLYRIKSFWRSVNPKNFLLRNMSFKIKTTGHYIRKNSSEEKQGNDFFLYFSLLYTEWNPFVKVSIRQIFFCEMDLSKWKLHVDRLQTAIHPHYFKQLSTTSMAFLYKKV